MSRIDCVKRTHSTEALRKKAIFSQFTRRALLSMLLSLASISGSAFPRFFTLCQANNILLQVSGAQDDREIQLITSYILDLLFFEWSVPNAVFVFLFFFFFHLQPNHCKILSQLSHGNFSMAQIDFFLCHYSKVFTFFPKLFASSWVMLIY